MRFALWGAAIAAALASAVIETGPSVVPVPDVATAQDSIFDHVLHDNLFPTCVACHVGAATPGVTLWPSSTSCESCHDGTIEAAIDWRPPVEARPTNLRFSHGDHADALTSAGRDASTCADCHTSPSGNRMSVQFTIVEQCVECHELPEAHLAVSDAECATCHVTLAEADRLSVERVAAFDAPPNHDDPRFAEREGHGTLAFASALVSEVDTIAASCATCHAQEFCMQCHVDAPEQPTIRALDRDARSLAHKASVTAPDTHAGDEFVYGHQAVVQRDPVRCQTCHTQESCLVCHAVTPEAASKMHRASPDRGDGATVARHSPLSHDPTFYERHGDRASARTETCANCHAREDCLECHRPDPGMGPPGYHPADFLQGHPAAAYSRSVSCYDCHSTRGFCVDCHATAGLTSYGDLQRGYHDAIPAFNFGHGPPARQNLESCVACHAERDCLTCHSAKGGRRFNPHGPGFKPEQQAKKNIEPCTVCHGAAVPRRPA